MASACGFCYISIQITTLDHFFFNFSSNHLKLFRSSYRILAFWGTKIKQRVITCFYVWCKSEDTAHNIKKLNVCRTDWFIQRNKKRTFPDNERSNNIENYVLVFWVSWTSFSVLPLNDWVSFFWFSFFSFFYTNWRF